MNRFKQLCIGSLIVLLVSGCGLGLQDEFVSENGEHTLPKSTIFGTWTVTEYSDGDGKVSMSERKAKSFLGKEIVIKPQRIKTIEIVESIEDSHIYEDPVYKYQVTKNVGRYLFDGYRVSVEDLPINEEKLHIIQVSTEGISRVEIMYLPKSERLLTVWNGYWYFAERPPWYSRLYSWCLSWF